MARHILLEDTRLKWTKYASYEGKKKKLTGGATRIGENANYRMNV